jgi:hypothetical protein
MGKKRNRYNWTAALRSLKEMMSPEHYQIVVQSKGQSFDSEGVDLVKDLVIKMYRSYKTKVITREAFKRSIILNVVSGAIYRNFINRVTKGIEEKGYSIVSTMADTKTKYGSTYTVGLSRTLGYDLIIINNAHPENRHQVLRDTLVNLSGIDKDDLDGAIVTFDEGDRVQLVKVSIPKVVNVYAPYIPTVLDAGHQLVVFQIVYPNENGHLPSDEEYLPSDLHPVFRQE